MEGTQESRLLEILKVHKKKLLEEWLEVQFNHEMLRLDLITENEIRQQSKEFLNLLLEAISAGNISDIMKKEWKDVRDFLSNISSSRAAQGFSPTETVIYIYTLKEPLFSLLYQELGTEEESLYKEISRVTHLLDRLGLYTNEEFQRRREELINRQQQKMLELSTPVVKIWDGILILPLIGTLDSERTQVVMENLLSSLVETGCDIAIIDITGVPTVDTLVAQYLLKTVAAAKLMGAECIISGIRPQIALTMVQLDLAFHEIITKSSLCDALAYAFQDLNLMVTPQKNQRR